MVNPWNLKETKSLREKVKIREKGYRVENGGKSNRRTECEIEKQKI